MLVADAIGFLVGLLALGLWHVDGDPQLPDGQESALARWLQERSSTTTGLLSGLVAALGAVTARWWVAEVAGPTLRGGVLTVATASLVLQVLIGAGVGITLSRALLDSERSLFTTYGGPT